MQVPSVDLDAAKRAAFSLLELVIAIAIIMVLVVLGVGGAYLRVRENANAAQCVQKLRNILAAEAAYSLDNDNRLVPYMNMTTGLYWSNLLAPYATGRPFDPLRNDWIICPSMKNKKDPRGQPMAGIGPVFTRPDVHAGIVHYAYADTDASGLSSRRMRFSTPSKVPTFMDIGGGYSTGNPSYCRGCYPAGAIPLNPALNQTDPNNFAMRHKDGANVGFLDGHVEWVSIQIMRDAKHAGADDFFQHFE